MRVDKVILKAIISTVAAIVVLFAIMFGALAAAFPSTMMQLSYDFGQDESSIRYAERAYEWFDDTYYMAYAMEVAIGCDNQEKIEQCGLTVVADAEYFTQYCAEKDAVQTTVKTDDYIYGKISVAKYALDKKEEAVNYAFDTLKGGFAVNNAALAVFYVAVSNNDLATVNMIKGKMEQQQAQGIAEGDMAYFKDFEKVLGLAIE